MSVNRRTSRQADSACTAIVTHYATPLLQAFFHCPVVIGFGSGDDVLLIVRFAHSSQVAAAGRAVRRHCMASKKAVFHQFSSGVAAGRRWFRSNRCW